MSIFSCHFKREMKMYLFKRSYLLYRMTVVLASFVDEKFIRFF